MTNPADRRPPFVMVAPSVSRHPVKPESLRRRLARYSRRTWILLVLAVAMAAMFWRVAGVWLPTTIATIPNGIRSGVVGPTDPIVVSADESRLAIWRGQTIEIYDRQARKAVVDIPFPGGVNVISFSQDGRSLLTQDGNWVVRLFDVFSGEKRFELHGVFGQFRCVFLSPDGSRLADYEKSGTGALWDCDNGRKFLSEPRGFQAMRFTPDGKYFAAMVMEGNGMHLRHWKAADGTRASDVVIGEGDMEEWPWKNFIDFGLMTPSPDSSCLAYLEKEDASKQASWIHVTDAFTGAARIKPVQIEDGWLGQAFTPDGKCFHVYTRDPKQLVGITAVDLTTGKVATRPSQQIGLQFCDSPDSRLLACQGPGYRGTLVMDSRTLRTVASLPGDLKFDPPPFSADGRRLVVRENDSDDYAIYDTHTWSRVSDLPVDDIDSEPIMLADGSMLGQLTSGRVVSWTHHRPDAWWGVGVLWEFWVAVLAMGMFGVSALVDRRRGNPAAARRRGAAWWEGAC